MRDASRPLSRTFPTRAKTRRTNPELRYRRSLSRICCRRQGATMSLRWTCMRARFRAFSMFRSISEQSSPLLRNFGREKKKNTRRSTVLGRCEIGVVLKAWLVCCVVWGTCGELPITRQFRDRLPGSDSDVWYETKG